MSEQLNHKQVFEQIVKLQEEMGKLDQILFKIQCISESQEYVEGEDGPILREYSEDVALEKINTLRQIVVARETTYNRMLNFYLDLFQYLENKEENEKQQKANQQHTAN